MPSCNDFFFYFELVSGFLGLCQAKWNEILRTNPVYALHNSTLHQPASYEMSSHSLLFSLSLITQNLVMNFKNSEKQKCALILFLTLSHKTLPGENSNCNNSQIFLKKKRFSSETWKSVTQVLKSLLYCLGTKSS